MVPKLHAKGKSFKGAAAYLLHDKDRATSAERVAWTEVRNLATDNPQSAWKVMAATAMKQGELKEKAGIKNTGRKSSDSVLHFSLSWHPDEKSTLTREEMMRAAIGALGVLDASDRQALIICHNDEKQPHVHLLVNRVSAIDGKMLPSSKEKLALSKWAQAYERDRGQIYCENRVLNNGARDREEYTRGEKDQARHLYEAEQTTQPTEQAKNEQRQKDAALAKQMREMRARHRQVWREFEGRYRDRVNAIRTTFQRNNMMAKTAIRDRYRPEWRRLHHHHEAERRAFVEQEKSLFGRLTNVLRAIDFASLLKGKSEEFVPRQTLGKMFEALSSAGIRLGMLKQHQERQMRSLASQQKKEEKLEIAKLCIKRDDLLIKARTQFELQRNDHILVQKLEGAKLRTEWKTRGAQRMEAWGRQQSSVAGTRSQDDPRYRAAKALVHNIKLRQRTMSREQDRERDS